MNFTITHKECADACLACASACNHCAAACTWEEHVKMMACCICLDMECASICYATAQLLSLGSDHSKEMCRICAEICEQCADECSKHFTDHCRACAKACLECAVECRRMAIAA